MHAMDCMDKPSQRSEWRTSQLYVWRTFIWGIVFGIAPAAGIYLLYLVHSALWPPQSAWPISIKLGLITFIGYYIYLICHVALLLAMPAKVSASNDCFVIRSELTTRDVCVRPNDIEKIVLGRDLGYDIISSIRVRDFGPAVVTVGVASDDISTFVATAIALNPSIIIVPYDDSHPGNIIMKRILRHW